ncbi:DUF3006 domain-containing protein [Rossellomorea vietnamensis]|uniref:DUF3006 domain-containing protein n=1 Tax=Rossellomorea vietnamensis TaxID=218284 RepID=A0A5D4MBG4_9BACI|nr:DUF3006 domain-containing protein [Rossellomorea vietnamensis]TYR99062.1 DUF3006 domain-containing protein [Rossellomorea vietnamensis]
MNSGKYTVDQIENGIALLLWREEEEVRKELPVSMFPFKVKEGDIIKVINSGGELKFTQLKEETEAARKKADDLLNKLINKNK